MFGTPSATMNAVLIGSFVIILTGVVDDLIELSPIQKFTGQLISALVVVFYGGLLIKNLSAFDIFYFRCY